ncbi:hypothetical protein ACS0TY_022829 [Phlomoides rotata]
MRMIFELESVAEVQDFIQMMDVVSLSSIIGTPNRSKGETNIHHWYNHDPR